MRQSWDGLYIIIFVMKSPYLERPSEYWDGGLQGDVFYPIISQSSTAMIASTWDSRTPRRQSLILRHQERASQWWTLNSVHAPSPWTRVRYVYKIVKTFRLTSIKHRSDAQVSDQYLIDVNQRVFAIWVVVYAPDVLRSLRLLHILGGVSLHLESFRGISFSRMQTTYLNSPK